MLISVFSHRHLSFRSFKRPLTVRLKTSSKGLKEILERLPWWSLLTHQYIISEFEQSSASSWYSLCAQISRSLVRSTLLTSLIIFLNTGPPLIEFFVYDWMYQDGIFGPCLYLDEIDFYSSISWQEFWSVYAE
jgi:hypothetical protein